MPMYTYKCDKCQKELDVLRRISESDLPPQDYEMDKEEASCPHEWKRFMNSTPAVAKGWNWGPGKGNWAKD